MTYNNTFLFILLSIQFSWGQTSTPLISFTNPKTHLYGFKNLKGKVIFPAKYGAFTRVDTLYNIAAVEESSQHYYLLKDGRKVGKDSVYIFDFTYDCESEGKILYSNLQRIRVGFFDKNGVAIIPAIYNYALPFRNGLSVALRNARRECWGEEKDTINCEHLGWVGGQTVLINDKNEILIDSLQEDYYNLDLYSLRINDPSVDTSIFVNIKGTNGNTYSFINYEKEFSKWFYNDFLLSINTKNQKRIKTLCFPEITFRGRTKDWVGSRNKFLNLFPNTLTKERFDTSFVKERWISKDDLNLFTFEKQLYKRFYDACGNNKKELFPVFSVRINHYKKRKKVLKDTDIPPPPKIKNWIFKLSTFDKTYELSYQETFEFIRTEEGYKLLYISL